MTPEAAKVALAFCNAVFTACPQSAPAAWQIRQMAGMNESDSFSDIADAIFGKGKKQ